MHFHDRWMKISVIRRDIFVPRSSLRFLLINWCSHKSTSIYQRSHLHLAESSQNTRIKRDTTDHVWLLCRKHHASLITMSGVHWYTVSILNSHHDIRVHVYSKLFEFLVFYFTLYKLFRTFKSIYLHSVLVRNIWADIRDGSSSVIRYISKWELESKDELSFIVIPPAFMPRGI